MWRDTARDFTRVPILMLPLFAPLSEKMVEHLLLIEYQPYRRAVVSSWPSREEVWQRILERVTHARNDVCEYMDIFVADDLHEIAQKKKNERTFPDSEWILEQLAAYPPNIRLTEKALEKWQSRNILRREQPRGRWRLDDVAALLIMRVVNTTHQKGWLPESIPEDEPRWWCFGKAAPDAPAQSVPLPLQGDCDKPHLLWTSRIGAAWDSRWQRKHDITACWSRHFANADEVAVWHTIYAQEIHASAQRSAQVSTTELRFSQDGELLSHETVQTALRSAIQEAIQKVQQVMLREAEQLILEEQARLISKEK